MERMFKTNKQNHLDYIHSCVLFQIHEVAVSAYTAFKNNLNHQLGDFYFDSNDKIFHSKEPVLEEAKD